MALHSDANAIVTQHLIRAAVAGALAMAIAAGGFLTIVAYTVDGPHSAAPLAAAFIGMFAGGFVGGLTFAVLQFPRSGRMAALVATVICVILSGAGIYFAYDEGKPFDLRNIAAMWIIAWPFCFVVAMWSEIKHLIARLTVDAIKDRVRRKP